MTVFPVSLHMFPTEQGFEYELTVNDESSIASEGTFSSPGQAFDDAYKLVNECLEKGLLTAEADRHVTGTRIESWRRLEMLLTVSLSK